MNEDGIVNELLKNGFSETSYKSVVDDKFHTRYMPNHRSVKLIVNGFMEICATEDTGFCIELSNGKLEILGNHQDYWGGWYKNRFYMDVEKIQTLEVVCKE